jgi:hypothetical protein
VTTPGPCMTNWSVALAIAACTPTSGGSPQGGDGGRLRLEIPPAGSVYHGVHAGSAGGYEDRVDPAELDAYESAVGRKVAWVYFSSEWNKSRAFPMETAAWIHRRGAVPFVRLMLRSSLAVHVAEPLFTLEAIARGDFDDDLRAWADGAHTFGSPVLVEWGTEMNGDWFAWSARWSGDAAPEQFRRAYRRVVRVMAERQAPLGWVFHFHVPDAGGERFERYWPGDDVVDWVGLSCYGPQTPAQDSWPDFTQALDEYIPRVLALAPGKPIVVAELGTDVRNPRVDPVHWSTQAFDALMGNRWPSIRGFSWWSESWPNDDRPADDSELRVARAPAVAAALRARFASPNLLDRPIVRAPHGE